MMLNLLLIFNVLNSCASLGVTGKAPEFRNYLPVECPKDKALIYIVREKNYAGSANMINLWANDTFVTQFRDGSYYALIVEPGVQEFKGTITNKSLFLVGQIESKAKGEIKFLKQEFEEGKTYYLELIVKGMNPKMSENSLTEGEQKIKTLKLYEYNLKK